MDEQFAADLFSHLSGNLRLEYDSYKKEVHLTMTNPYTGKRETLSTVWIHDLDKIEK